MRRTATFGFDYTDDRGEYRFGGLPGGTYYLAVTGQPWYSQAGVFGQPDSNTSVAYASAYYPNTLDAAHAEPISVTPGGEVRADFALRTVPGAKVTVAVDAPQRSTGTLYLSRPGIGGANEFERTLGAGADKQVLQNVPPGHYELGWVGTGGIPQFEGRQSIDVNGADIEVQLTLRPTSRVSGTVRMKNPAAKPRGSILVGLHTQAGAAAGAAVRPDGSFSFPSIPRGKYRPILTGVDGYFASEIRADGAAFRDGRLELAPDSTVTLNLVASDETGLIQGFVVRGDQPVAEAMAVLAPQKETTDSSAYLGCQTESDGSFEFPNVPAGDYFLFAVEDTGLEYTNPAVIRPHLPSAKRIRVEPHGSSSERIPLETIKPGSPG